MNKKTHANNSDRFTDILSFNYPDRFTDLSGFLDAKIILKINKNAFEQVNHKYQEKIVTMGNAMNFIY